MRIFADEVLSIAAGSTATFTAAKFKPIGGSPANYARLTNNSANSLVLYLRQGATPDVTAGACRSLAAGASLVLDSFDDILGCVVKNNSGTYAGTLFCEYGV